MSLVTVKYAPHQIAKLFPEMTADEMRDLTEDIRKHGLLEPIILFEGQVLDGRSRQIACAKAGVTPNYTEFMDLRPSLREDGPLAFAVSRNVKRRHLTPSQKAIIAAETIPAFEAEAKERQLAALKKGKETPTPSASQDDNGTEPVKGRSAEKAAKAAGVSKASVERARKVLKKNPKKAAEIKAGKGTVGAAARDKAKEAAAAKAAIEAAKGLTGSSTIAEMCAKARGGKLMVVVGDYKITVTKVKVKKAATKK